MRAFLKTVLAFLRIAWARIRGFVRPGAAEQEFDEELAAHLSMAEEEKIHQGMSPEEARRIARVELGGLTQLREAGREARGLPWLSTSWLDVKLALRMLRKSWGLTLVAGLAMTVVIGFSIVVFDVMTTFRGSDLPLDEGERVVALLTMDVRARGRHGTSLEDFERWRSELRSVENVAAVRMIEQSLVSDDGTGEAVAVAEMTASAFRLVRVPPLMGRHLVEDDERHGAAEVIVIGEEVWRSRFGADPEILDRELRLDDTLHAVVGVMPADLGFPVAHQFWTPLRFAPEDTVPGSGPDDLLVCARLRPGVEIDRARAELSSLGLLPSRTPHEDGKRLEARLVPYAHAFSAEIDQWVLRLITFLLLLLLLPPCLNIAILVYARTVTRQGEFAARYALGARRGNIIVQLFVELLVLAGGAAIVALTVARVTLRLFEGDLRARGESFPFWMDFGLSVETVLFAAGLAVLAALIAGAVPALQATGRRMQSGLRSLGSHTRVHLGRTWTALVVLQVAFSFALLPTSVEMTWGTLRSGLLGPGFAAEEYLTARLETATQRTSEATRRFPDQRAELVRRLREDPAVSGVTVSSRVPGEEPWVHVEIEEVPVLHDRLIQTYDLIRFNFVDDAFFDVFQIQVLTGRGFLPGDFESEADAVIVDRTFVEDFFGDANPLGHRVRYIDFPSAGAAPERERWYEIVGVAANLRDSANVRTIYHPSLHESLGAASLSLRVSDQEAAAERLRQITTSVDPTLRLAQVRVLDDIYRNQAVGNYIGASALVAATLSVLLLSAAGMYALMTFTLNQRRKEIGIRSALGAQPHRLLAGIFGHALSRVAAGAAAGVGVALFLAYYLPVEEMGGREVPGILPTAAALMVVVGALSVVGPARRGLRVNPIEELRES